MFNEKYIDINDFDYMFGVAVHEVTHALGFISSLYGYWKNEDDVWHEEVSVSYTVRDKNVTAIATPNAVEKFNEQINCEEGLYPELEEYGGSGTAGSHWELRIGYNEYMVGYAMEDMTVSKISLALFEDMGWYEVNWEMEQVLEFAYMQDCEIVTEKCAQKADIPIPNFEEFCYANSDS